MSTRLPLMPSSTTGWTCPGGPARIRRARSLGHRALALTVDWKPSVMELPKATIVGVSSREAWWPG